MSKGERDRRQVRGMMQGLVGHCKDFSIYSEWGRSLEGAEQNG